MSFHVFFEFFEKRLDVGFQMTSLVYELGLYVHVGFKFLRLVLDIFGIQFQHFLFQLFVILYKKETFIWAYISNKSVS